MNTSFEPGTLIELAIDAAAHGGDGVGRVSGLVCFVSGALPGDTVRARVDRRGPRAVWAHLEVLLEASPSRLASPPCPSGPCASACSWRAFAYPAQADWKRRIVADSLQRIGGLRVEVGWAEEPACRLGYRTRAAFHGDGATVGYYARQSHTVIPMSSCPLNHDRLNTALGYLQETGLQGDVLVTVNPEGAETLVWMDADHRATRERFPLFNIPRDTTCHQFLFDGAPIVNGVFSQSSLLLNRLLRERVCACIGQPESLLDLYCGNGNFSLPYNPECKVLGIDHTRAAVNAAARLAPGAYLQGNDTAMNARLAGRDWDAVVLDPPRTGARALTKALAGARAKKMVYVSCDPATLARDLREILSGGWTVTEVTAVDMFPHTPHVETVCLLERT